MELNQVITLIHEVSESNLTGFSLEEGNIRLRLEKQPAGGWRFPEGTEAGGLSLCGGEVCHDAKAEGLQEAPAADSAAKAAEAGTVAAMAEQKGEPLKSPLVGTFYNASSPEAEPFVRVGDRVRKGQVLGIIEAMKLMNEIEAEQDGVVEAVLVENEQMVEYGQPLFTIL